MRKQPERELANACTQILEMDGFRTYLREPVYNEKQKRMGNEVGEGDRQYVRFAFDPKAPGVEDSPLARAQAQVLWIEWKASGGRLSPAQKLWHAAERSRGALTVIAKIDFPATVDGFIQWYEASGLARRRWIQCR